MPARLPVKRRGAGRGRDGEEAGIRRRSEMMAAAPRMVVEGVRVMVAGSGVVAAVQMKGRFDCRTRALRWLRGMGGRTGPQHQDQQQSSKCRGPAAHGGAIAADLRSGQAPIRCRRTKLTTRHPSGCACRSLRTLPPATRPCDEGVRLPAHRGEGRACRARSRALLRRLHRLGAALASRDFRSCLGGCAPETGSGC